MDLDFKYFTQRAPKMNPQKLDIVYKTMFQDEGARFFSVLMNRLECLTSAFYYFQKDAMGSGLHTVDGYIPLGDRRVDLELKCHWNEEGEACTLTLSFAERTVSMNLPVENLFNQDKLNQQILEFRNQNFIEF